MMTSEPAAKPANPHFSSGPCAKRPGWTPATLEDALLGRSHRSGPGKARLQRAIDLTREVLEVPDTHRIAIVPASDTGAVEMAMWTLLGARGVDVLAWESFGLDWVKDAADELKLDDLRTLKAGYGDLPDLGQVSPERDVVFTWNGTTSGVRVPDGSWIPHDRSGLTICDATSAAFAQELPWDQLDATTFSWQKAMGGEAQHGMLVLSPRAVERLESFAPPRPLPKLFRLTKGGKINEGIFRGETINTPSMLCVEDYIDALEWARSLGGLSALRARADANVAALSNWVRRTPWIDFLAREPETRSNTSVCLTFADADVGTLAADDQTAFAKAIAKALDDRGVAHDIASYRSAPPGLRIWCGCTVETSDVEALTPWLDWAYAAQKAALKHAA